MKKVKWVSVLAAALLVAGIAVAGCTFGVIPGKMGGTEGARGTGGSEGGGGEEEGGGGGVPLPSYTMIPFSAGTVTTTNTGSTNTTNWGAGANAAYVKPCTIPAFKMGETEVTYELWDAVKTWAEANEYTFANAGRQGGDSGSGPVGTDQHPVTEISWRDAVVWCNAYSEATGRTPYYLYGGAVLRDSEGTATATGSGKAEQATFNASANGFRLPTEAQWEYAARGGVPGTGTPWTYTYAGTNTEGTGAGQLGAYAWYHDNSDNATHAVKTKTANSKGLHDMSGNVYEWCQDISSGAVQVVRGGSWGNGASNCAVSDSIIANLNYRLDIIGFRVACP